MTLEWAVPPSPDGLRIALDVETTGLHWAKDRVFWIAMTYPDGSDWWLDLREPNHLRWAKDHIHRAAGLDNQNIKFDCHFLRAAGIQVPESYRDTMIYAALLNEFLPSYDLDSLAKRYLGLSKHEAVYPKLAEMFGGPATRRAQMQNLWKAPQEVVQPYAQQDTRLIAPLLAYQEPRLQAEALGHVAALEMELIQGLVDLEHPGVRVDVERAQQVLEELRREQAIVQRELNSLVGFDVAVQAKKDMHKILEPRWVQEADGGQGAFFLKDGTRCLLTKGSGAPNKRTGNPNANAPSLDAACLQACSLPEAQLIVKVRKLEKICGTFLEGHILGTEVNGRVYPHFHQTKSTDDDGDGFGTSSGRMSCSEPNLQQIPKRDYRFKTLLRSIFQPEEGHEWVSADFSSIDFRVMCNYLNDPRVNEAFEKNPDTDFHQWVADMTGLPRNPKAEIKGCAKTINLGCAFGTSAGRVAKEMGLPFLVERKMFKGAMRDLYTAGPEAQDIFNRYHAELPGLKPMLKLMSSVAKDRGYIRTLLGRRSRFPGGEMSHKAGPMIFQGGAGELMKVALVRLHKHFRGSAARLLLTVHDEASMSMPRGNEEMRREMVEIMESRESFPNMRIPVRAEISAGADWAKASGDGFKLGADGNWVTKRGAFATFDAANGSLQETTP